MNEKLEKLCRMLAIILLVLAIVNLILDASKPRSLNLPGSSKDYVRESILLAGLSIGLAARILFLPYSLRLIPIAFILILVMLFDLII